MLGLGLHGHFVDQAMAVKGVAITCFCGQGLFFTWPDPKWVPFCPYQIVYTFKHDFTMKAFKPIDPVGFQAAM
jgi:hypothetical protein